MKSIFRYIKPYILIIAFLLIPLSIFQLIKKITNQDKYESEKIVGSINTDEIITTPHIQDSIYGIVIHGGAGNYTNADISPKQEAAYKAKLYEALQLGIARLKSNDSSIYVVEAVIKTLEDSPLFNAGKGAVYTHKGTNELDASIMDGLNKNAGAISGSTIIKNPISAALAVMQKSEHVLLSGQGANEFAKSNKIKTVNPTYFYTERRWNDYLESNEKKKMNKHGTVGCVVLDKYGNLAAGTSTGGMSNKKHGRIGDSPIIGAGTYADNSTCAVSCTGHGEFFIRHVVAYDVAARMKYKNATLKNACTNVINDLHKVEGYGGLIAIDKNGNFAIEFNTNSMFRAYFMKGSEAKVRIFK